MEKIQRIGIIGAGFSGSALAATLARQSVRPIEIVLFEKNKTIAAGEAYSTPFPFHYLNVRAHDMSAFEDDANHFVNWLQKNNKTQCYLDSHLPIADQFVPRMLYHNYLKDLLHETKQHAIHRLQCMNSEVIDIETHDNHATLILNNHAPVTVDKAVLAIGHTPPAQFSFNVPDQIHSIEAWDYLAPTTIAKNAAVLIVGTGLSMIDAVLTLSEHQHRGKIYALSRRGLMPLHHADRVNAFELPPLFPKDLRTLTRSIIDVCRAHCHLQKDWRAIIMGLRPHIPMIWENLSTRDRQKFLRHVLPYWNIHRHRVHAKIADKLQQLQAQQQLEILSGRLLSVNDDSAEIYLRKTQTIKKIPVNCVINCMGPNSRMSLHQETLVQQLFARGDATSDALDLGFDISKTLALKKQNGDVSTVLFTVGPPTKGFAWECTSVPHIRQQIFSLAKNLLI